MLLHGSAGQRAALRNWRRSTASIMQHPSPPTATARQRHLCTQCHASVLSQASSQQRCLASRVLLPVNSNPRVVALGSSSASWPRPPRHPAASHRDPRCFSTGSSGSQPGSAIPWLETAEVLQPLPSANNNGNGSPGAGTVQPGEFRTTSEEELRLSASGDDGGEFDAIMILAGGLTADGGLPEYVQRRLDVARGLHLLQERRPALVCLGGGTPHKPSIIGPTGHVLHESTSCAAYLIATGVQPASIYKETSSYDTVGNAYFSLTMHALPAAWRRVAVVTSAFHMPRSRALFADSYRAGGRSLFGDTNHFELVFLSASDQGVFDQHVYTARLEKEAGSLAHWQSVAPQLTELPALHAWLFSDHLCYAVGRQHEFGQRTIQDPKLLESY